MYSKYLRYIVISSLTYVLFTLSGCFATNPVNISYPADEAVFADSLTWYKSILNDNDVSERKKARAHLNLALLYSHYRNPEQDYDMALIHIDKAMELDSALNNNDMVKNLKTLLDFASGKSPSIAKRLKKLQTEYKELQHENAQLIKTIEELNELEVELEKRRKLIR